MFTKYKNQLLCRHCKQPNNNLHFHHVDPSTKFKGLSKMIEDGYGIEKLIKELKKCIPLCGNCHIKEGHRLIQYPVDKK